MTSSHSKASDLTLAKKEDDALTTMQVAAKYNAPADVVALILPLCRENVKAVSGKGCTALHHLATARVDTVAEMRNSCALCYLLVAAGVPVSAVNGEGQTAARMAKIVTSNKAASSGHDRDGVLLERPQSSNSQGSSRNYHLGATLKEIATFVKRRPRLRMFPHFRDWTTVSHAWCAPSAQLTALTVLLVGETYKRGLLPRLPMDAWYWILNWISRWELRQGRCTPAEEAAAKTTYTAILADANSGVWITKVAKVAS